MKCFCNILFAILLLTTFSSYAQNADSLQRGLSRAGSDKARSAILFSIGRAYNANWQFDTAVAYLKRSIAVSREVAYDSMYMEACGVLSDVYRDDLFDYNAALHYSDTAVAFARRLQLPVRLEDFLVEKASALIMLNKAAEFVAPIREALALTQAAHNKQEEARVYWVLAIYYSVLTNHALELDYVNRAIHIYDSLQMHQKVADGYRFISVTFSTMKKWEDALHYAVVADSIYAKLGRRAERIAMKSQMAIAYKRLGNHQLAIRMYKECIDSIVNDDYLKMNTYANLARAQVTQGSFAEARKNFAMALSLNEKLKVPESDLSICVDLSDAFVRLKQLDSALYFAKQGEIVYKNNAIDLPTVMAAVLQIHDVYEARNEMGLANAYYKQYVALQDSMYRGILTNNTADAEARFNLSEKNKEITLLAEENELQKVKAQKQTLLSLFLLVVVCLGVVIVVLIVTAYRRTLKKNTLLSEQKEELETQQQALQDQKNIIDAQVVQLANAAQMKSRFLANISHELRTPVTLLNGMLEIMSDKKQGSETRQQERLDIAYNNSRKLHQMVEEILDLTKLEHNKSQPTFETVELAPLLRRIIYAFETLMEKEQLVLEYEDARAAGIFLLIDVARFEKVINNLVYNAIKFNKPGGYVRISAYPSADGTSIRIDVADSGIGIAAADLPHIFEHFYQGDSLGLKAAGAGIGLSLVKEYTTLMGGDVQVQSTQGEGTTFALQFESVHAPVAVAKEDDIVYEQPVEAWEKFEARPKLLLVEDNAEMRYYLSDILGDKVDMATAGNGFEGLASLERSIPDIIISDVMMPGMDGREFIAQLKSDERYRKIPIITLTSLSDKGSELSFLRMGVDDYIVKPFNVDELRIRVYNLLVNLAGRKTFIREPVEAGDEEVVPAGSAEAEEFRTKVTEYVLSRVNDLNLSVDDLAADLFMSKRQLYRMAKSLSGFTPAQLIKEIRLQRAYELLLKGKITKLEDVCNRVGYEKTSYFAQQFYERFGKRPTDFL